MTIDKKQILIIDDDFMNIRVLSHILDGGYDILTATNGKRGIEMAHEFFPDLILLDIEMPEMDGYEVIAKLKEDRKLKNIPVLFVTGNNAADDEWRGLQAGAVGYIGKPFHSGLIRREVMEALAR